MGSHPLNLGLRFLLELTVLFAAGNWGWKIQDNWHSVLYAILVPVVLMIVWGIFNVTGDPSRSGNAPIETPGWVRLIIEIAIFSFGVWCLYTSQSPKTGLVFALVVAIHYLLSYDRIVWLLSQ